MPLVKVQKRGQVKLPTELRAKIGVLAGDVLEAKLERGRITLTPKPLVGRRIAESIQDYRRGRAYGPFDTAEEMIASLRTYLATGMPRIFASAASSAA